MRVRLVPLEGGTPIDVSKDLSLVGRREDCDIFVDHKSVSKLHCVVARTDGLLLLRDLGSTNGTRVNGERVRRAALLPNDQLQIANVKFSVQFAAEEPSVSPDEFTQQMDGKDVEKLVARADKGDDDSEPDIEAPLVRANTLPDRYVEKPEPKKKK